MHESCTFCARSYLASAKSKLLRARLDKPSYAWDAVGVLMEASNELVMAYPRMANVIVKHRIALEDALRSDPTASSASIPFDLLMGQIATCEATKNDLADAPPAAVIPAKSVPSPEARAAMIAAAKASQLARKSAAPLPEPTPVAPRMKGLPTPPTPPALPNKPTCTPCEEAARVRDAVKGWRAAEAAGTLKRLVGIVAPLSDFNPSYSLVTVILHQVRAVSLIPDTTVALFVRSKCDLSLLPPMPANVHVIATIPSIPAGEDNVEPKNVAAAKAWLKGIIAILKSGYILTHDLIFQSWFTHWAQALHEIGDVPGIHFYHWMHSSVGTRPGTPAAAWRTSVPKGHTMVALNTADLPYLQRYYDAGPESFVSIPNPRDIRVFYGMPQRAMDLVTKHGLHLADVVQVFPLSGTRMQAKGVTKVIDVFNALCKLDPELVCRLLICDAHANGTESKNGRELVTKYATSVGLPDGVLAFASDLVDPKDANTLSRGLDAASIRCLLQVANVFIFPTTSEAGSLVLMEAALAGNLLVLNESLPCMADYISSTDAIWVPFGSTKEAGGDWAAADVAARIQVELGQNKANSAKRAVAKAHCIEAYMALLQERVFTSAPTVEPIALRPATLLQPASDGASP